jgi:hypothetical protein
MRDASVADRIEKSAACPPVPRSASPIG